MTSNFAKLKMEGGRGTFPPQFALADQRLWEINRLRAP
jgi:hypothetical protein